MLHCTITGTAEIPGMVTGRSCLGCLRSGAKLHRVLVLKQMAETLRDTDRAEKKKSSNGFAFLDCLWQAPWRRATDPQARLVPRNGIGMVQGWRTVPSLARLADRWRGAGLGARPVQSCAPQTSRGRCLGSGARAHFQGSTPTGRADEVTLFWGDSEL